MKQTALTTSNLGDFTVAITPDALTSKADALALAKPITAVSTAAEQQDALAAAGMCKALIKGMESTRVEVKEPALAAGRLIDHTAKQYSAELDTEMKRLERLASEFQAKLNAEAARIRAEEQERQRKEVEAAERIRQQELAEAAERERKANAERLADLERIQSAKDETERLRAMQAADDAAERRAREVREQELHDAEMAEHRAEEARQRALQMQELSSPKVSGARQRVQMDYELLDIHALYRSHPHLVKLDVKRADLLTAINIPGQPTPGGIRVFESTKVQAVAMA